MQYLWTKIILIFLIIVICSCNAVKHVPNGELLLHKNHLLINGKKVKDTKIKNLIYQRSNIKLLGIPLKLHVYNSAVPNSDSILNDRMKKKLEENGFWVKTLSKKQFVEWFHYKKAWHHWRRSKGEAPVIINPKLVKKSKVRLQKYYTNKGYFNNEITIRIDTLTKKKRAEITYDINLHSPYIVDHIAKEITNPKIDSLYDASLQNSVLKTGAAYNSDHFKIERARLRTFFKNNGVYNFQDSSIQFQIDRDTVKTNQDQKIIATVKIGDRISIDRYRSLSYKYKIFTNDQIHIYPDFNPSVPLDSLNSIHYKNLNIRYYKKLKYHPKALADLVFMKKDSVYSDLEKIRTQKQISHSSVFNYPSFNFVADTTTSKLNAHIFLRPKARYSFQNNFDVSRSNIQDYGITFKSSLNIRNIFRGLESVEFSARGTLGSSSITNIIEDTFFNISEIGGDININFPRILFPLTTDKIIPKYMFPRTSINLKTNIQKNIGLDRQTLNANFTYHWKSSNYVKNQLELFNVEFIKNAAPNTFYNVYRNTYNQLNNIAINNLSEIDPSYLKTDSNGKASLIIPEGVEKFIEYVDTGNSTLSETQRRNVLSIKQRQDRLTQNNLIFSSSYSYTYNSKIDINDVDFYQFRGKVESAGGLLSLISNFSNFGNIGNSKTIFGVPFSQYIKTEFDFIKHWYLKRNNILAFRTFMGIAIPYGNLDYVPFIRSYFGGGTNDNRAWNAYSLGPGATQFQLDFNEANFKLAFNLEYRFNILGNINGAIFGDAGNIWNIAIENLIPEATFQGLESLKDLALGTGFGFRYDFNYFVLRFDVGFKTHNPQRPEGQRWFYDYNFGNAVYQFGINYPF